MHGRHETVKYCLEKMPFIDKYMIYSTNEDAEFLKSQDVKNTLQVLNEPLSFKWNEAVKSLKTVDFDAVILLGSDDFIDEAFVDYVSRNIKLCDLIGFKDIYFKEDKNLYYWSGYQCSRKGEPAGAGKTYSKEFLERINYDLFPKSSNYSLDGISWGVCKNANAEILITSLKSNGLMLCDIKDGKGMTKLSSIKGIEKL